jgi:hypothetical protein
MNRVFHRNTTFFQRIGKLAQDMLCLGRGHSVAGHEHCLPGVSKQHRYILDIGRLHLAIAG